MKLKIFSSVLLVGLLLAVPAMVWAHTEITVGDYKLKYGWKNEPPIAGDANAVTLDIVNSKDANAKVDITELKAEVLYGGESKVLTIAPVFGQTNKFQALLTPTRPGQYTVRLSGKIGATEVKAEIKPEEVEPADTVEFPRRTGAGDTANASGNLSLWLALAGAGLGLAGVSLSLYALKRK